MGNIIPKLNLNKIPHLVDNNSLIFAKNIRLSNSGSILRDCGIAALDLDSNNLRDGYDNVISKLDDKIREYRTNISTLYDDIESDILTKQYAKGIITFVNNTNYDNSDNSIRYNSDNKNLTYRYGIDTEIQDDIVYEDINVISPKLDNSLIKTYNQFSQELGRGVSKFPIFDLRVFELLRDTYLYLNPDDSPYADFDYELFLSAIDYIKDTEPEVYDSNFIDLRNRDGFTIEKQYTDGYNNIIIDGTPVYEEYSGYVYYEQFYLRYLEQFFINHGFDFKNIYDAAYSTYKSQINEVNAKLNYYTKELANIEKEKADYQSYDSYITNFANFNIVGVISYNTKFYIFYNNGALSFIGEYDELTKFFKPIATNWNWSGGKIKGNCVVTLNNEIVLNICEYDVEGSMIPFKSINITNARHYDNESFYTQSPDVPLFNLNFKGFYNAQIAKGTYQFFIRYKFREDQYTNWHVASRELSTADVKTQRTIQGYIKYVDDLDNSNHSFIFDVSATHNGEYNYESFQIGFIINQNDTRVARAWKHFDMNTRTIYFDNDSKYISEIDVEDLLKTNYSVYNVENMETYKNQLYIANYNETDFNPDLTAYAKRVLLGYSSQELNIGSSPVTVSNTYVVDGDVYDIDFVDPTDGGKISGWHKSGGGSLVYQDAISNALKTNVKRALQLSSISHISTYNEFGFVYTYDPKYAIRTASRSTTGGRGHYVLEGIELPVGIDRSRGGTNAVVILQINNSTTDINYILAPYSSEGERSWYPTNLDTPLIDELIDEVIDNYEYFSIPINGPKGGSQYNNVRIWFIHNTGRYVNSNDDSAVPSLELSVATVDLSFKIASANFETKADSAQLGADTYSIMNVSTLIPGQKYRFYIHYVKSSGEYTNGYHIDDISIDENLIFDTAKIYYPTFENIVVPEEYTSCFISIQHLENKIIHLFDNGISETIDGVTRLDGFSAIELDCDLYTNHNNLDVAVYTNRSTVHNFKLKYYSSSEYDTGHPKHFGNNGIIDYRHEVGKVAIIKQEFADYGDEPILIKCTPYITAQSGDGTSYISYKNLTLLGHICRVIKPSYTNLYGSANSLYVKDTELNLTDAVDSDLNIALDTEHIIYSNYNLNFISLRQEANPVILTLNNSSSSQIKKVGVMFESLTLSSIYKLSSSYWDIERKTFSKYKPNEKTRFDNTIRRSKLLQDELKNIIYTFDVLDYYNIPTDKGKITNIVNLGNNLLVHTEDSAFVFKGDNIIKGSSGDIQQRENDIFDTGCSELYGTKYGYGGLQDSKKSVLTPNSYIYLDEHNNRIFAVDGNFSTTILSDELMSLLQEKTSNLETHIKDCSMAYDVENNKVYIYILFNDSTSINISYNLITKSFVSLHDFKFSDSFNTKSNLYFIRDKSIYALSNKYVGYSDLTVTSDKLYPIYNIKQFSRKLAPRRKKKLYPIDIATPCAIVDVIFNVNYENIKRLSYLRWSASKVESFGSSDSINMAEENKELYAGNWLRLYSDSVYTDLFDISKIQNQIEFDKRNNTPYATALDSYKYPRDNQGMFNFNYFRDIKNIKDIFKYKKDDITETRHLQSDNNSLIYGKYIVARFIFDISVNFRLDTVYFDVKI